jgi:hypothetical protein
MEVTGVLSVNNALEPQDIEVTPTTEDITIEPAEGCYIRSVVVKAIPADGTTDEPTDEPTEPTEGDTDGD